MCDTWRIRKTKTRRYTFRQQHSSGYIQRRVDFLFSIFNSLQKFVKNTDVLVAFSTDRSPTTFSLFGKSQGMKGRGLWKRSKSLFENDTYIENMKKHIITIQTKLKNENITDEQCAWKFLKYDIR